MKFLREHIGSLLGSLLGYTTGLGIIALSNGSYLIGFTLVGASVACCGVAVSRSYLEYRQKRLKDEPHLPCERPGGLY